MKATRHNGRSGKNGTYNPRHNDRRFDLENSEHIDAGRVRENIYWDCYRGYTTMQSREEDSQDISFEEIECTFYQEHYGMHIEAQNERNARTRHTERNRSVEDLLKNNKTCPEETIFQIGTVEESVSYEILLAVVQDFTKQFTNRFGSHVHILDWALHLDEGTPHIHERHVFDCENRYGEIAPQQEKALEALGFDLPNPDQKPSKLNNRKMTFDAACRAMLFDITLRHGLHLDQEPEYGGRAYLEKQDYILMKQTEKIKDQDQVIEQKSDELEAITIRIEDTENFVEEVADAAYEKAVEVVTKTVQEEVRNEDFDIIAGQRNAVLSNPRLSDSGRKFAGRIFEDVMDKFKGMTEQITNKLIAIFHTPTKKEEIKQPIRESIRDRLARGRKEADAYNSQRRAGMTAPPKKRNRNRESR